MKKLLILLTAAILAATSCNVRSGLAYHANIYGSADGNVLVAFPDGKFNINGDVNLVFNYGNDSVMPVTAIYSSEQINASTDKVSRRILRESEPFCNGFNVTSAGGNYDLIADLYVTDEETGITIKMKKRWTNKDNEE